MNRKGTSNLFEIVTSRENLLAAAKKAQKNIRRQTNSYKYFVAHQDECIDKLQNDLISGRYKTSKYFKFTVHEPKEREICALPFYPDRIVHHACMSVLLPIWKKKFTADTYNCLKGKGTHGFVKKLKRILQTDTVNTQYCLQMDIHHFYPTIDHNKLKEVIRRTIKDKRLLALLDEIIDSVPDGVPIGNYLSQFFALLFLTPLDHYVKERLKVKYYLRYCDDLIALAADKKELLRVKQLIVYFLREYGLEVKTNARIFPVSSGIDVVGYKFFHTHTLLRKRTKLRFERKCMRAREAGKEGKEFKMAIGAYLGLLKYANAINLERKYLGKEYDLCIMKSFQDIAQGKDKIESYEGAKVQIPDLLDKEIELVAYRLIKVNGKEKAIIQAIDNGTMIYFFTGSAVIKDKLDRYGQELPFTVTIVEVKNKYGRSYYTFK